MYFNKMLPFDMMLKFQFKLLVHFKLFLSRLRLFLSVLGAWCY